MGQQTKPSRASAKSRGNRRRLVCSHRRDGIQPPRNLKEIIMFKTILMTAAAALLATAAASPAHAVRVMNGGGENGRFENGLQLNGSFTNGSFTNGSFTNIRSHQGTSTGTTGFVIDGIELPAQVR
jgi:hypothetical protein